MAYVFILYYSMIFYASITKHLVENSVTKPELIPAASSIAQSNTAPHPNGNNLYASTPCMQEYMTTLHSAASLT